MVSYLSENFDIYQKHLLMCPFMLSQINHKIRKGIQTKKNVSKNTKDNASFVERSYVLYNRPYIHWIFDFNGSTNVQERENSVSVSVQNCGN